MIDLQCSVNFCCTQSDPVIHIHGSFPHIILHHVTSQVIRYIVPCAIQQDIIVCHSTCKSFHLLQCCPNPGGEKAPPPCISVGTWECWVNNLGSPKISWYEYQPQQNRERGTQSTRQKITVARNECSLPRTCWLKKKISEIVWDECLRPYWIAFFFCLFAFSRAASTAHGDSQTRGLIGAIATGLRQSHRNAGS